MTTHKVFPYVLLFIGICIAATSAILVRMAQMEGVPSMSITSWRLIFAVTLLTPFVWYHNGAELRQLQRNEIKDFRLVDRNSFLVKKGIPHGI